MSSETINPITPAAFALAITDLPIDTLHSKAAEIENSIQHLRHSNEQMLPFADQGDQDCKDAMFENLSVIGRMNERIGLLRAEVERRGLRWSEAEVEDHEHAKTNGVVNGDGQPVNGLASAGTSAPRAPSGRLTDEELRRQLEAQMSGMDEEDDGVHL